MEQIRVLHIVTYMGRGGLETMLMNYYRNIDRSAVQFDFLVHREFEADYDKEIRSLGGRIYHISRLVPWSRSYRTELKQFFMKHPEYQIVHVHQDCLSSVALECAKECGVPVRIAHSHNANQDKNIKYPIKLYYRRFIPRYATDLFACGKTAGDWMFQDKNYQILNNAIPAKNYQFDIGKRERIRKEMGLDGNFVLGLVASFTRQKNHRFLLEIFRELYKKDPDAKLLLVGAGELREEIENHIRTLNIQDSVILAGIRADVQDLLQAMDAFVMPSLYEGLSLAAVEAQASGLPCYISDTIPSECRITDLVQQIPLTESAAAWADIILQAKNTTRRNTYQEISDAGFDIEKNVGWLQNFYLDQNCNNKLRTLLCSTPVV